VLDEPERLSQQRRIRKVAASFGRPQNLVHDAIVVDESLLS
jgi:hypothetical protein